MNSNQDSKYLSKSKILKALAHPTRLWMAEQLAQGERCVCEFFEAAEVDFSTISKHLTVLKNAGLVVDEKRGKQVFYRLQTPCLLQLVNCIDKVIQSNSGSREGDPR